MQNNQPHPIINQQLQHNPSHVIYSDEDIDVIEDEQKMEPSDLAWNSNSMYDRLEPLEDEKPAGAEEQATTPQINISTVHSQIKSHSTSAESSGNRIKPPEVTKSPHEVFTPPPPPPPPKIPSGQFVAPPHSPKVVTTNVTQPKKHGELLSPTTVEVNERPIDCGNDQIVRRIHPKEPPKPETVATRNALMAWMMEQQSK